MKLHPTVKKFKAEIRSIAELRGLNLIDFRKTYSLAKTGAKRKSANGYPDRMIAVLSSKVSVVGTVQHGEVFVWIAVGNFVTSPVVSCKKLGDKYLIETENSFYQLIPTA